MKNIGYANVINKPTYFQSDWTSTVINKPSNFQSDWTSTVINKPTHCFKLSYYNSTVVNRPDFTVYNTNSILNSISCYFKLNILQLIQISIIFQ